MDFDYFILDMGVLNTYTAKEFFKCDKRFIVCSLSKWKQKHSMSKIEDLLSKSNMKQDYVTVISNLSQKKSSSSFVSFPFIENPFQLTPEVFSVFYRLLERQ